jgi:hypothetical protein
MDSRKSEGTRTNIWRLPVRGANRSKTISGNKESTELRRHRSRPTIHVTARRCIVRVNQSVVAGFLPIHLF